MFISKDKFFRESENVISDSEASQLWSKLEKDRFNFITAAYILGLVLLVVSLFWIVEVNNTGSISDGINITIASVIYLALFILAGYRCYYKLNLKTFGGLLALLAVLTVPVFVKGLQQYFGLWLLPEELLYRLPREKQIAFINNGLVIELAIFLAGWVALYFFRFYLLLVPVIISGFLFAVNCANFWEVSLTLNQQAIISMVYGLVVASIAYLADWYKKARGFVFWGYLLGLAIFWVGLYVFTRSDLKQDFYSELFLILNIMMIFKGIFLRRTIFAVFGALGVFVFLMEKFYQVNDLLFPLVLSLIGALIIGLGYLYQRNQDRVENLIFKYSPDWLLKLRP